VAFGTAKRKSQPSPGGIPHALCHVLGQVFFVLNAPFGAHHAQPVVARCNFLLSRWVRKQIPCELFDGELIEWFVGVERRDHVLPEGRDAHFLIAVVSDGVGIANQVQPPHGHALAKVRGGEESVYQPFVSTRRIIPQKLLDVGFAWG
jgi:hypothetical protein